MQKIGGQIVIDYRVPRAIPIVNIYFSFEYNDRNRLKRWLEVKTKVSQTTPDVPQAEAKIQLSLISLDVVNDLVQSAFVNSR